MIYRFRIITKPLLMAYSVLFAILYVLLTSQVVGAASFNITGKVTSPTNTNVANASVHAVFPGTGTIMSGPVLTNSLGNYTLPIDAGTYDLIFDPGFNSLMSPVVLYNQAVSGNQTRNQQLPAKIVTMSGKITDGSSNAVAGATIRVLRNGGINGNVNVSTVSDSSGNYSLNVQAGTANTYQVSGSNILGIGNFTFTSSTSSLDLSQNITRDLNIPTTTISVSTYNNAGQVTSVNGSARAANGSITSMYPGDGGGTLSMTNSFTTNFSGQATFKTIVGAVYNARGRDVTDTSGGICFLVNQSGTFKYDCSTLAITATSAPASIAIPAAPPVGRTFSGTLIDGNGNPMPNVVITLKKYADNSPTTTTDSNGNFTISAEPNTYFLSLQGYLMYGMSSFTLTQSFTTHTIDLRNSDILQNVQIPTVNLTTTAYDYMTSFLYYNTSVNASANSGTAYLYAEDPGHTTTVNSNGFSTTTSPTGTIGTIVGTQYLAKGVNTNAPTNSICVRRNPTSYYDCLTSAYTVNGAANISVPY